MASIAAPWPFPTPLAEVSTESEKEVEHGVIKLLLSFFRKLNDLFRVMWQDDPCF